SAPHPILHSFPTRRSSDLDIENQVDFADVFQGVLIEIDELLCAEVESRLTGANAPGADDVGAGLTRELGRHRTDYAGRAVHEDRSEEHTSELQSLAYLVCR